MVVSELPGPVVWSLTLSWGKVSVIIVSTISFIPFFLSSHSGISIMRVLHLWSSSHSPWIPHLVFLFQSVVFL